MTNSAFKLWFPVLVGALGYFVDIYDLVLFGMVRIASLKSLGLSDDKLLDVGVLLLNCQMAGLLVGGVIWGVLGDKRGRLSVLFGSILLYSVANIANGFVQSIEAYAVLRFIAGIGLAGELGAAITLVSETLPAHLRGYGTAIVGGIGLSGAIAAGLTCDKVDWRTAYIIGGSLGLCLLVLRFSLMESQLFLLGREQKHRRGDLLLLVSSKTRFLKYLYCIGAGIPIWYVAGILMTFSPEISRDLGIEGVTANRAILFSYAGIAIGDLVSGSLSQYFRSRKRVIYYSLALLAMFSSILLSLNGASFESFYFICFLIGLATGYWVVFVTIAAEEFGTNLRATVSTSVPNFVRGSVVPLTFAFQWMGAEISLRGSAAVLGISSILLATFCVSRLEETHGKDLNYFET
jgi:MFS transporter, putative metabolite:H+ symporter